TSHAGARGVAWGSQFPSKVGGRPAWLSLGPLPGPERLRCGGCGEPLLFLLQVVLPAGPPRAFHRALLLFCCRRRTACGRRSFLALRSQLPRHNPFYPPRPPPPPGARPPPPPGAEARLKLCRVCGAAAPKSCSRCRRAHYCGREHQAAHWRAGHREACQRPPGERERGEGGGRSQDPSLRLCLWSPSHLSAFPHPYTTPPLCSGPDI
uniref:MYND-type domain-containing protein n=1 Tax=Callorhinchus milii TaxID=7868 RepID=A0A4W3HP11_CALMI